MIRNSTLKAHKGGYVYAVLDDVLTFKSALHAHIFLGTVRWQV
jgi:hypothetical protein